MQGLHLTADLYQCSAQPALMHHTDAIAALCQAQVQQAGLTQVDERWVQFPPYQGQPGGVTGTVLLAESHLAIHTWPETGNVTLDVYVCNFSADNTGKARALLEGVIAAYAPSRVVRHALQRGDISPSAPQTEAGWVMEQLTPHACFGFDATLLERRHTGLQQLELWQSPQMGRMMRLDGRFMTSERDEFFYHEALIHPATTAHPSPRTALIIGGGDGGAAEELLKHRCIEKVVLAELDGEVIAAAQQHLPAVHRGVWDDPRLQVQLGDGLAYIDATDQRFDLLFLDLTDPDTPASALYSAEALTRMRRALAPGGALVLHLGSPVFHAAQVQGLVATLQRSFAVVRCYGLYVPLYGAYWGMAVASDALDAAELSAATVAERLAARGVSDLQYYNPPVHGALFALPTYYGKLVAGGVGTTRVLPADAAAQSLSV